MDIVVRCEERKDKEDAEDEQVARACMKGREGGKTTLKVVQPFIQFLVVPNGRRVCVCVELEILKSSGNCFPARLEAQK